MCLPGLAGGVLRPLRHRPSRKQRLHSFGQEWTPMVLPLHVHVHQVSAALLTDGGMKW